MHDLTPDQNRGNTSYFHASAWTTDGTEREERGLIQFDYSSIPAGAIITKATLTLFADTTTFTGSTGHSQLDGPNDWSLRRVTQSWDESTVTWNNAPSTDSSIYCAPSTSASQAYVLDLTTWVKAEIANPTAYFGFLAEINNKQIYRSINFCTSDNKYPELHPQMVIEYVK